MWTDNLSVGVKNFDEDHKRMIRMINELHVAIEDVDEAGNMAEDEVEIALHRLENYIQYHCIVEERLMEQTGYPELRDHRKEHQGFTKNIAEMAQRFRGSQDPKHAMELMQFMYGWLTEHIFVTDRKYSQHLQSKGFS